MKLVFEKWRPLSGAVVTHPEATKDYPGELEAHAETLEPQARPMEAHHGASYGYLAAGETKLGAMKDHPLIVNHEGLHCSNFSLISSDWSLGGLPKGCGGSPWNCRALKAHPRALEAHHG
jgi:hypothetical protein